MQPSLPREAVPETPETLLRCIVGSHVEFEDDISIVWSLASEKILEILDDSPKDVILLTP
jgi:hypothetical protein